MEAVGAAASILSLLGGATQYGKCLYETVSSLKTAPQQVASLASALRDLQDILSQLQNEVSLVDSDADLSIVTRFVTNCHDDLRRYKKYLDKVASTSGGTKAQKAWKTVMVHLTEKDIQRIREELIHHISALAIQLNVLQSSAARLCTNRIIELHDTSSNDSTQRSANLLERISQLSTIHKRIDDLEASIAGRIQAAAEPIMQRVESSSNLSASKGDEISNRLKAIETRVGEPSTSVSPAQITEKESQQTDAEHKFNQERYKEDAELTESMDRLAQLAMNNAQDLHDEDADMIIEDLERILNSIPKANANTDSAVPRRRKAHEMDDKDAVSDLELKRFCGTVVASQIIGVNKSAISGKIIRKRRTRSTQAQLCEFDVMVDEKSFLNSDRGANQNQNQLEKTETTATVKAILKHTQPPTMLTAYLRRTQWESGYFVLNPVISVGRILPSDSLIFKLVRSGDVEGLQDLLSRREGTLRDRDEKGAPLLHRATYQPRMCKFLIENGADVDEIALNDSDYCTPLGTIRGCILPLWEPRDGRMVTTSFECRRLLLREGADPTIEVTYKIDGTSNPFRDILHYDFEEEPFRDMLDLGAPFIDYEVGIGVGTLLTDLARCPNSSTAAKLQLLLDRGADVNARAESGKTSLHLLILAALTPSYDNKTRIVILISNGADVDLIDDFGQSVTDLAYRSGYYGFGGYRGDLWDAALLQCGYDVHERRLHHARTPRYNEYYRREDFEKLWEGREEHCPYFDDPPHWPPGGCVVPFPAKK